MPRDIAETHEFVDRLGTRYRVSLGSNEDTRSILVLEMQGQGAREFHPVIEMDVDVASFYADIKPREASG